MHLPPQLSVLWKLLCDDQLLTLTENFKPLWLILEMELYFKLFFPSQAFKPGCHQHTYAYSAPPWTVQTNYIALFNSLCPDSVWNIFRPQVQGTHFYILITFKCIPGNLCSGMGETQPPMLFLIVILQASFWEVPKRLWRRSIYGHEFGILLIFV